MDRAECELSDSAKAVLSRLVECAEWMQLHGVRRVYVYPSGDDVDWTVEPREDARIFTGWTR